MVQVGVCEKNVKWKGWRRGVGGKVCVPVRGGCAGGGSTDDKGKGW